MGFLNPVLLMKPAEKTTRHSNTLSCRKNRAAAFAPVAFNETCAKPAATAGFRAAHAKLSGTVARFLNSGTLLQVAHAARPLGDAQEFPPACKSYATEVSSCWMKRFVFSRFDCSGFW
jgi:hypothetical protein